MNSCFGKFLNRNESNLINTTYKIISEFEKSSEKECSKADKENEKIYSKLLTQAQKAQDAIKNSGLSMNLEVPIPPRPSNRDRFILWKKRNIEKRVIDQTEAVLYLQKKGYQYNIHYEAYQAVDLAAEIKKKNNEPEEFEDNSKNFSNIYTQQDKNILRRRSIRALSRSEYKFSNTDTKEQQTFEQKRKNRASLYGFDLDNNSNSSLDIKFPNFNSQRHETSSIQRNSTNINLTQDVRNLYNNEEYIHNNNYQHQNNTINVSKPSAPPVTSSIIIPRRITPRRIRSQETLSSNTQYDNHDFETVKASNAPSAPPLPY
jgi:hypothetical protein